MVEYQNPLNESATPSVLHYLTARKMSPVPPAPLPRHPYTPKEVDENIIHKYLIKWDEAVFKRSGVVQCLDIWQFYKIMMFKTVAVVESDLFGTRKGQAHWVVLCTMCFYCIMVIISVWCSIYRSILYKMYTFPKIWPVHFPSIRFSL